MHKGIAPLRKGGSWVYEFRIFEPHQRIALAGITCDMDLDAVEAYLDDYAAE